MAGKIHTSNDGDEMPTMSEINITPFVDVVLVLLVIFMVTAPMLVREQMNVNLPKATTGEKSASESIPIVIDKLGAVTIKGVAVSADQIEARIKEVIAKNPNEQAVISADEDTKHGDVVHVIDEVKKAGLNHFAIQIERR
jgi:biopolymer transport protein ExbD